MSSPAEVAVPGEADAYSARMPTRRVAVLGGGVAGLASALLLARGGHDVTLVERDPLPTGPPLESPTWPRRGISHFLQPHAFTARGCQELRQRLPDVHADLIASGAVVVECGPKIPGGARPGDEDLQFLAVRRPLIEWALRRAVLAEAGVRVLADATVTGVQTERGQVTAVVVGGEQIGCEVVVDAMGRRTPIAGWLSEAGVDCPPVESSECGVVYYSRYYRVRAGFDLPDGRWVLGPRGDLGYLGFSTFPGDNRTFAALLAVPRGVSEWRVLNDAEAFEAVVALIPGLRIWVNPEAVEPITDVLPLAGMRNSLRVRGPGWPTEVFPVGDALSHTDPVLAHGLSFGLIHAAAVTDALAAHEDLGWAMAAYDEAVLPELRRRYDLATELDSQRFRGWSGEPVDFAHHDGDYALFSIVAGGAAAMADADVFRVVMRRLGLLDSTLVLDDDLAMQQRIEQVFGQMISRGAPPSGPSREELLTVARAAAA